MSKLANQKCIPCEGNVPPLAREKAEELLRELDREWMLIDDAHMIARSFHFKNFEQTMKFVNEVARIAEDEGHHPDMSVTYDGVGIELSTHAIGGLSENDFILASKIDQIKV